MHKGYKIAQVDTISFFVSNQLPIVVPLVFSDDFILFCKSFFDSKQNNAIVENIQKPITASLPKIYAIISVLPIFCFLFFQVFSIFSPLKLILTLQLQCL